MPALGLRQRDAVRRLPCPGRHVTVPEVERCRTCMAIFWERQRALDLAMTRGIWTDGRGVPR